MSTATEAINVAMLQGWRCEVCDRSGTVEYQRNAGVCEVINKLCADHIRTSPECLNDIRNLRLTDGMTGD